jgi:hypothetical protein
MHGTIQEHAVSHINRHRTDFDLLTMNNTVFGLSTHVPLTRC